MKERGFALVAVLWASMILAVIAASVLQLSRSDARLTRGRESIAELNAAADGVMSMVIHRLQGLPDVQPPLDGIPFSLDFNGHRARVAVWDESGKVDLNRTSVPILRQVLLATGLDVDSATAMADRIADWRDPTLMRRPNGAKADDYRAAGLPYGPRNAPFRSVAELRLVMGMTDAIFQQLVPMVTVYSETPWIDPTFASPRLLGLLRAIDPNIAAILRRRDSEQGEPGAGAHRTIAILGHAYAIAVSLEAAGPTRVVRNAVVRLTGRPGEPVWVYEWR